MLDGYVHLVLTCRHTFFTLLVWIVIHGRIQARNAGALFGKNRSK